MIANIVLFEIRYRLKRPATYIYFAILFIISFLITSLPEASVSEAGEQLSRNAPYVIAQLMGSMLLISSIIVAGIMGVPVYRDYSYNFDEIIFSLPVKRWQYLLGRFIGSYTICFLVHLGIVFGLMAGPFMPWIEAAEKSAFILDTYINPMLIMLIPNIYILGVIFFIVGSSFRSQLAIYAQGIVFFAVYYALNTLLMDVDTNPVNSILEPFGSVALSYVTKYWTTFEKNNELISFGGLVLYNRLLWIGLSTLLGVAFYLTFSIRKTSIIHSRKRALNIENKRFVSNEITLYKVSFTKRDTLTQWLYLSKFYWLRIMRAIPFWIILSCGIGIFLLARFGMGLLGTPELPVTYTLLDTLEGSFMFFFIILLTIYTGEIVWKDIDVKMAPVFDATPVSNRILVLSKFTALIFVILVTLVFLVLTGIGIQVSEGYYNFQMAVYFKVLMLNTFPYLVLITFAIFLIHTLINNKYLGHTIVILFFLFFTFGSSFGLRHVLVSYASSITRPYSDMNGFHHFVFPALITDFYWLLLGVIFLITSILLIKRGNEISLNQRIKNAKESWKSSAAPKIILICFTLFVLTGAYIYYNTNILNTYRTVKENREIYAQYERQFSKFKNYPQPRITDVNMNVDIFPHKLRFGVSGKYKMINNNNIPIDSVHLRINPRLLIREIKFNHQANLVDSSKNAGYYIYSLDHSLEPGDSLELCFDLFLAEHGFNHSGHNTDIVYDGSFIHSQYIPSFGYDEAEEIHNKRQRKKAGLPPKIFETADLSDSTQLNNIYINTKADRINYEAVISTVPDQIAITCGTLIDEWTENGRRYFHYKMNEPIWNFYPFLSARYEVFKENHKGVDIEIFYHKGHDFNLETMADGIRNTIDYCSENFLPYQHEQLRIVEFPRYSTFAQSFAGTIPYSEGVGFIADVDDKNDIDLPFYVNAHEVAHQWWGHQVCAANVKGKELLVESLAEYSAMMILQKQKGVEQANKFRRYQLDRYLLLRATERVKEPPLYLMDNQPYLSYQKGSLALYNLQDFIGEDSLNNALAKFLKDYAYKEAPYPTSLDLIRYLRDATPDSLDYIIDDWFEKITLYTNRTDSANYQELENGKYRVKLYTTSIKYSADSLGKQESLDLNDWLDIGIYSKNKNDEDTLIYVDKKLVNDKNMAFDIIVDQKPVKAGIDPLLKQIDRNVLDNTKATRLISQ